MSVSAETGSTAPTTLTPLRSDKGAADNRPGDGPLLVGRLNLEPELAVVEQQLHARGESGEYHRVGQRHARARAGGGIEVEPHAIVRGEPDRPIGQPPDA